MSRPEYYGGTNLPYSHISDWGYTRVPQSDLKINYTLYEGEKMLQNPIGQPLVLVWQENGKIEFRGCKDYEDAEKMYKALWGKPYLKLVKSVILSLGEVGVLAAADRVKREVAEAKLAHEKKLKEEKDADEKEYNRLKAKLGHTDYSGFYSTVGS